MPAPKEPRGSHKLFTDEQLRGHLSDGWNAPRIAEHYGCSKQAVYQRIKQLGQTTAAAAVAPEESQRYVSVTLDAIAEISRGLERTNLMQDACDRELRDPDDPRRYDLGPRSEEVSVIYQVLVPTERGSRVEKRKAPLARLLAAVTEAEDLTIDGEQFWALKGVETKRTDIRELHLKTVQEVRQTAQLYIDLMQRIRDAQVMEAFREEMLRAIGEAAPEVQIAIEERLRARLVRYAAASGLGALPGG